MKKIFFFIISLATCLYTNAQVKKQSLRPAAKKEVGQVSQTTSINFFDKNADDVAQLLSDQLKKSNITLTDIADETTYDYDEKGEKTTKVFENVKILTFSNSIRAYINANNKDEVDQVRFSINNNNRKDYLAIKKLLNIPTMQKIVEADNDTTYKSNDTYASINSRKTEAKDNEPASTSYSLSVMKTTTYDYSPSGRYRFYCR
jgi:hypothetical protein